MPDFPIIYAPPRLSTFSGQFSAIQQSCCTATPTSGSFTWPAANLAIYVPFAIPFLFQVSTMFWGNGSTVSGNVDVGYYTSDGARVFSTGAIAQSGASVVQFSALANFLDPGTGYLAMLMTSATGTCTGISAGPAVADYRAAGLRQQAVGAGALPATATFAQYAQTVYPLIGVER
jgi:hypothetical protein